MSLKKQIIIWSVFICGGLLLLSNLVNYRKSVGIMQAQIEETLLQTMKQAEYNVEQMIGEVDKLSKMIGSSDKISLLFSDNDPQNVDYLLKVKEMFRYFENYLIHYDYVDSIFIINEKNECIGLDRRRTRMADDGGYLEGMARDSHYDNIRAVYPNLSWTGPYRQKDFISGSGDSCLLTAGRMITPYAGVNKNYFLYINIKEEKLRSIYGSGAPDSHEKISILDGGGLVLSGTEEAEIGGRYPYLDQIEAEEDYGFFTVGNKRDETRIIYYRIKNQDWLLVREVPLTYLNHSIHALTRRLVWMLLVSVVLIVLLYSYLIGKITGPLYTLILTMQISGQAPGKYRIETRSRNEIGRLIRQFNDMNSEIADLIKEKEEKERKERRMEIELLQTQINPHFLYNTLNMIKWMAMMQRADNITDSIVALSGILKPVYTSSGPMHSIREELEYLKSYMIIMNYRFSNHIRFLIQSEEELMDYQMLRFSLQPILENSFAHGFEETGGAGSIVLGIRKERRDMVFTIRDTGKGIETDQLQALREKLDQEHFQEHVGLENIHKRLKLNFGGSYGLRIESDGSTYTQITMIIPQIKNQP